MPKQDENQVEENHAEAEIEQPEPAPPEPQNDRGALLTRIEAHDKEGEAIEIEMTRLGLDKKQVKQIRKAQEQAAATKKTLDALMGLSQGVGE